MSQTIMQLVMLLLQVTFRFLSGYENRMGYEARREWNAAKAKSKNPQSLPPADAKILEKYYEDLELASLGKSPFPEKTDEILRILSRMPVSTNNEKGAYIGKLGKSSMVLMILGVFLTIFSLMFNDLESGLTGIEIIIGIICAVTIVVSTLGVWNSFANGIRDSGQVLGINWSFLKVDVHFWETIQNGIIVLAALLGNMDFIYILASVTIGQIFHRGEVNRAFKLPYIMKDEITDDPTGKTYGIPLLDIAVRRLSNGYLRVGLAIGFVIWIAINELFIHFTFNLPTIISWFK